MLEVNEPSGPPGIELLLHSGPQLFRVLSGVLSPGLVLQVTPGRAAGALHGTGNGTGVSHMQGKPLIHSLISLVPAPVFEQR